MVCAIGIVPMSRRRRLGIVGIASRRRPRDARENEPQPHGEICREKIAERPTASVSHRENSKRLACVPRTFTIRRGRQNSASLRHRSGVRLGCWGHRPRRVISSNTRLMCFRKVLGQLSRISAAATRRSAAWSPRQACSIEGSRDNGPAIVRPLMGFRRSWTIVGDLGCSNPSNRSRTIAPLVKQPLNDHVCETNVTTLGLLVRPSKSVTRRWRPLNWVPKGHRCRCRDCTNSTQPKIPIPTSSRRVVGQVPVL